MFPPPLAVGYLAIVLLASTAPMQLSVAKVRDPTGERYSEFTKEKYQGGNTSLCTFLPGLCHQPAFDVSVLAVQIGLWQPPHTYVRTVCRSVFSTKPKKESFGVSGGTEEVDGGVFGVGILGF